MRGSARVRKLFPYAWRSRRYTPQVIASGPWHLIVAIRRLEGASANQKTDGVMFGAGSMTLAASRFPFRSRPQHSIHEGMAKCGFVRSRRCADFNRRARIGSRGHVLHVVRNLLKIGDWNGISGNWTIPAGSISEALMPGGLCPGRQSRQAGPMLGAAYTSLHLKSTESS